MQTLKFSKSSRRPLNFCELLAHAFRMLRDTQGSRVSITNYLIKLTSPEKIESSRQGTHRSIQKQSYKYRAYFI